MWRIRGFPRGRLESAALAAVLGLSVAAPSHAQIIVVPPTQWALQQNTPDPFCHENDGETVIYFAAPQPADVQFALFSPDSTAVVRPFMNSRIPAGMHALTWDGRDDAANVVPDGRYPYTLVARDISTQEILFAGSKAMTIRCVAGVEARPWCAVKSLFR
jgi:flagellar hook assembly protein FlgD